MLTRQNRLYFQAADIFLKAAAYIRTYGWREEEMNEHGQPRCSMGALASAHQQIEWNNDLAKLMYKALYDELDGLSLTQFNHINKDGEKVAVLYEKTAKKLAPTQA